MASIPGSVRVGGFIAPSDTTDTYATHDSLYGRGGLKEVSSTEERDAIPADRRREGMVVYVGGVVQANYQLIGGIDNANWAALDTGGGGGVTDHGALTGLGDDDHTQYFNETRGDARYQPLGTYSTDIHSNITALNAVSGTNTGDQDLSGYSLTSHTHAGVYEPADATILKDADIGVTVQAYDADLTSWAAIAPSAKQDTLISGTNIKTINSTSILGEGNIVIEGSGTSIPVQETAPESPSEGDLWVDSDAIVTQAAIPVNWTSPTVITDTANLTYGSYNIVSVTAADKTLTLPEITSSDYGKFVVVEIAASTTKLITIDGYSTQTIDGATTRIMWASEVAVLVATSSGWIKVGGKSVPMFCDLQYQGGATPGFTFNAATVTKIPLATVGSDNTGLIVDTTNSRLVVKRSGLYTVNYGLYWLGTNTTNTYVQARYALNGTQQLTIATYYFANNLQTSAGIHDRLLHKDDILELYGLYGAGSFVSNSVFGDLKTHIGIIETPNW